VSPRLSFSVALICNYLIFSSSFLLVCPAIVYFITYVLIILQGTSFVEASLPATILVSGFLKL
jgi:hypothetical protein